MGSGLLKGKVALVTGAGRGIGQSIAEAYASEGAHLVLTARSTDQLNETAEVCKKRGAAGVEVHSVDLSNIDETEKWVQELLSKVNKIDVLVNNAGRGAKGNAGPVEGDPHVWQNLVSVNLLAAMVLIKYCAPPMQKARVFNIPLQEGIIINIGSEAAVQPVPAMPVYCASKHALRGYSLSCYEIFRKDNVKTVLINPGPVATNMTEGMGDSEKMIQASDIAETALLPIRCTPGACPVELTVRVTEPIN